jgi:lipopolysaccharide export system permease protein
MPLLARYLLSEYLKFIALLLTTLLMIFFTIHFLEKVKRFSELSAPVSWIVQYLLLKLPKMISDLMPIALFLSTLLTLGALTRNNEIVPILSGGISIIRITAPILFVGASTAVLFFFLNGSVVPSTYKRAHIIARDKIEKEVERGTLVQDKIWLRLNSKTLLYTQMVESQENAMYGVHLYYLGGKTPIEQEIEAESLRYENATSASPGKWVLSNGTRLLYQEDGMLIRSHFERETIQIDKTLIEIQQIEVQPDEMTYDRLASYVNRLQKDGLNATRYQVGLHQKWAFAFSNFILALLAIPISFQYLRQGGMAKSVMTGLGIVLLYWLLLSVAASLGRLETIPPVLAGWGPHLLFLLIGATLFARLHRLSE